MSLLLLRRRRLLRAEVAGLPEAARLPEACACASLSEATASACARLPETRSGTGLSEAPTSGRTGLSDASAGRGRLSEAAGLSEAACRDSALRLPEPATCGGGAGALSKPASGRSGHALSEAASRRLAEAPAGRHAEPTRSRTSGALPEAARLSEAPSRLSKAGASLAEASARLSEATGGLRLARARTEASSAPAEPSLLLLLASGPAEPERYDALWRRCCGRHAAARLQRRRD